MSETNNNSVNKNLKYILILIGALAFVLSYFLVYNKYTDKTDAIQTEIDSLQVKCDDLESKDRNKKKIQEDTKELETKYQNYLAKFDGGLSYDAEIMDNFNMSQNLAIKVPTLSLSAPAKSYEFGKLEAYGGNGGMDAGYSGDVMSYNVSTIGTYAQMKDTLNYIMSEQGKRKVPVSVAFSFDTTNQLVALNVSIKEYAISGLDRKQKEVVVSPYAQSRTNIFFDGISPVG